MDEQECKDFDSPENLRKTGKITIFNTLLASAAINFLDKTRDYQHRTKDNCISDNQS